MDDGAQVLFTAFITKFLQNPLLLSFACARNSYILGTRLGAEGLGANHPTSYKQADFLLLNNKENVSGI